MAAFRNLSARNRAGRALSVFRKRVLIVTSSAVVLIGMWTFFRPTPSADFGQGRLDFGVVEPGMGIVRRDFMFRNTGFGRLDLKYIGSTCGCAWVGKMTNEVRPGQQGRIVVELDSAKAGAGTKLQRLTFRTNDPHRPTITIDLLHGSSALGDVRISPQTVSVSVTKPESMAGKSIATILVADAWSEGLRVNDVTTSAGLTATLEELRHRCVTCPTGGEWHAFRARVYLSKLATSGPLTEWVSLSTNHPSYRRITIPVTGMVEGSAIVSPMSLVFTRTRGASPDIKRVHVSVPTDGTRLQFGSVATSEKWIKTEVVPVEDHAADIVVSIDETMIDDAAKPHAGEICIHTVWPDPMTFTVKIVYTAE